MQHPSVLLLHSAETCFANMAIERPLLKVPLCTNTELDVSFVGQIFRINCDFLAIQFAIYIFCIYKTYLFYYNYNKCNLASVTYSKCNLWQMYYSKCNYGKCNYGKCIIANVIMASVIMANVL